MTARQTALGVGRAGMWVLALDLSDPELFRAYDGRLRPRPFNVPDAPAHPSTKRIGRSVDRRTPNQIERARRTRSIDLALTNTLAGNSDPVIVVGADPTLAQFLARTRNAKRIGAVVRRAPGTSVDTLADVVGPVVAEMLATRRERALGDLDRAVGDGTAVSGIEAVSRTVHRSNPGLLIVEDGFEQPMQMTSSENLELMANSTIPNALDVVDEIIDVVLAAGGTVEFTPVGVLADHQRIAFVPSDRSRR